MNILNYSIPTIDFTLTIIILFIIVRYYYIFYGRYMHGFDLQWNKMIEKPRLFYLSFFIPTYIILQYSKYSSKTDFNFWIIELLVLFFYFLLICTMKNKILNRFVENKHLKELQKTKKNDLKYSKEKTIQIFNKINNIYINSTDESLYKFLNKIELGNNEKIIWIDITKKTNHLKTGSNRNTLVEFIKVAHDLDCEERNFNNKINSLMKLYFLNNFKQEFNYNDNNATRSTKNKSKYLDKISELFQSIIKH